MLDAQALRQAARAAGFVWDGSNAPIIEDIQVINKVSQNLHAEITLRLVGREKGAAPTLDAALDVEKTLLAQAGILPEEFVKFMRMPAPAWEADSRPWYGGFVWLNRGGLWSGPPDSFAMAGAGGQSTVILPTHDLVVVRMGHCKGDEVAEQSAQRALKMVLEAVPQAREPEKLDPIRRP